MRSPTIPATTPPPDRSFRDVTESRKAAEELRESQHLLELFFSQSLDGFFFMMLDTPMMWEAGTDKETALDYVFAHERITKINAAMLAQYGALEEELIGRTPGDLMAQDIPAARARWRALLDAGRAYLETDERTMDGRSIIIEGYYICLYDAAGRLLGHFGIQRDVTSRREAENVLVQSRQELRNLTARLQAVREEERTSIAHEVHDELGQTLTGLKIDLSWLRTQLGDQSPLADCVQSLIERMDGAMDTVRRIATNLRPSVLDHLGLVAAIAALVSSFISTSEPWTSNRISGAPPRCSGFCRRPSRTWRAIAAHRRRISRFVGAKSCCIWTSRTTAAES